MVPSIRKTGSGTFIDFNTFTNINETTTISVYIIKKKLLSISGSIPIESNFCQLIIYDLD
jgi:hypothetical protein